MNIHTLTSKALFVALVLAIFPAITLGARANQVKLNVAMGTPILLAGKAQRAFLKVGLTGFELKQKDRVPVNIAIVLDRSGSMAGENIVRAREAAITAVELLDERDIVSIITYDDKVSVLVPAMPLTDRASVIEKIKSINTGGSTALFAGVSKGAQEVRKNLNGKYASRVILLSDGQANKGPSTPGELGELGRSLMKEGIAVSTIGLGLGYNEDLMSQLAKASDGNHAFVEKPSDLAKIFKLEFGDLLSVVAQEVLVKVNCGDGVKPVRVLGREADITGKKVVAMLNQLYSRQEKFIVVEVEVPAGRPGQKLQVASVDVSYGNMATKKNDTLTGKAAVDFTQVAEKVKENQDKKVMVSAVRMVANEMNKKALELRDKGKVKQAQELLENNFRDLNNYANEFDDDTLRKDAKFNRQQAGQVSGKNWNKARKSMRKMQYMNDMQQSY